MRTLIPLIAALALGAALAGAGCGGGDDTTTVTSTTVESSGGGTTTGTQTVAPATTTTKTTPGGTAVTTYDCPQGQIYSQGAGGCVAEGQGNNPCPKGEVPAADQPACLPKE